jgi:hypothetical protein
MPIDLVSEWEWERAEAAEAVRLDRDPFGIGRWVVDNGIPTGGYCSPYTTRRVGKIVEHPDHHSNNHRPKLMDDEKYRYILFLTDDINGEKVERLPLRCLEQVGISYDIVPQGSSWNSKKQQLLEDHIAEIEDYIHWSHTDPCVPEWYLHSLRNTLHAPGKVPPDHGLVPPMLKSGPYDSVRCVHYSPREGYLELAIRECVGRMWSKSSDVEARSLLTNTMRDILLEGQRAILSSFRTYSSGHGHRRTLYRSEAVFCISHASTPCIIIDASQTPTVAVRQERVLGASVRAGAATKYLGNKKESKGIARQSYLKYGCK